ncbi:hypothetical protein LTR37_016978 [Vermiconidia calcicola]|uniref:Uncharacterized protein n=1 Tax=Vermiconidia calcicola TaxID=1690605 RepID=A0ACC3MMH6_9PEZI|nr:hypothetical protein LTR37_016978 [Vermiconidia calcicola]
MANMPTRRSSNVGYGSSDYTPAMRAPSMPGVPALAMSHHQQMQPQHQQGQQAFAPYQYMTNNQQLPSDFQNHHPQNNGRGFHQQEQLANSYLAPTEAFNFNDWTTNFHQGPQTPITNLQDQNFIPNLAQGFVSGGSWHTVHQGPEMPISSPASPFPQMDLLPPSTARHHGHHPQTMSNSQMRMPSYASMANSSMITPLSAYAPPAPQMLQQPMQSLHSRQPQGYDDQYQKRLAEACSAEAQRRRRAEQAARRGPLPIGLRTSQSPLQHQRFPSSQGQPPVQRTSSIGPHAGFGNGGNAHSAAYVNPQDIMTPSPRVMRIDSGYLSGEAPQPSPSSQSSMSFSISATPSPGMLAPPMRASTPATPGPKMPAKRTIESIQSQLDAFKEAAPKKLKTLAGPTSAPGTPSRDEIQAAYARTQSQLAAPFVLQPNGQSERRTKHIGCSRPTGGHAPRRVPEHVPTSVATTAGGRTPECDNVQNKNKAGTQGSPIKVLTVATPPEQSPAVKPMPTLEKMSGEQFSQILTAQTKSTAQTTTTPKPSVGPIRLMEGPVTAHENDKAILQGVLDKMKRFGASHGWNPQYGVPAENVQLLKIRKAWTKAFMKEIEMQVPSRMVPAVQVMGSAVDGVVEAA